MIYTFYKIYEMDYIEKVDEFRAKDLHDAMNKFYMNHKDSEYDIMAINGEWI